MRPRHLQSQSQKNLPLSIVRRQLAAELDELRIGG
jgi:hypothetical protein